MDFHSLAYEDIMFFHPFIRKAMLEVIRWLLTSGQKECSTLGYAPLPHEVASQLDLLDAIK